MTLADTMSTSDMGERLRVANDNWGATSLAAVHAVLGSVYDVLTDAFGTSPDALVNVARWDQDPRALYDQRPYEIRLDTHGRYWSQYVYQFSHELCHVLTGFDRYREHRHKWFEEALCESASLFVLHRLATVWVETPPPYIIGARDFAPNHKTYAEGLQNRRPAVGENHLSEWLTANIGEMEKDPVMRERNGVVAGALLGRFKKDSSLWQDCVLLNHWDPRGDASFADYLDSWTACLRTNGHEDRLAATIRKLFRPGPPV